MLDRKKKQIIAGTILVVLMVAGAILGLSLRQRPELKPTLTELAASNPNLHDIAVQASVEELNGYQLQLTIERVISSTEGNTLLTEDKTADITSAIITKLTRSTSGLPSAVSATYDDLKKAQQVIVHADENIYTSRNFKATKVEIIP
jgi:hypothetical protein